MGKQIKITDVQPGMVIVQVTQQNGAIRIKKSGLVSSPDMITGLAEMGVQEVEIDPSQTVEIDLPGDDIAPSQLAPTQVPVRSATRQLLESGTGSGHKADYALSEQFNRNLFLPSVQDIPSLWQYYSKRVVMAMLIVCGGVAIGWTGATYQQWLWIFEKDTEQVASTTLPLKRLQEDISPSAVSNIAQPSIAEESVEQVTQQVADRETEKEVDTAQSQMSADEVQAASSAPQSPAKLNVGEEPSAISPELLKRFEEAISELDAEPETEYRPPIESASDVPRVDQLPAWIMTQLPAMAFSAHMYASNIEERWVRVNGRRMVEGDMIEGKIRIAKIEPQRLILNYQGHDFSMVALTDW
jgi:general secretion pathway protein B